MTTGTWKMPGTFYNDHMSKPLSTSFPVLFVVNLDMVLLSEHTLVDISVEWTLRYPFGWMRYSAALQITMCLSVVTTAGEIMTADILKMLVLPALDQVSCPQT